MATYLAHDALRLPAASLLANSGLCVNIEIEIWLLLGVNVATAFQFSKVPGHWSLRLLLTCVGHLQTGS